MHSPDCSQTRHTASLAIAHGIEKEHTHTCRIDQRPGPICCRRRHRKSLHSSSEGDQPTQGLGDLIAGNHFYGEAGGRRRFYDIRYTRTEAGFSRKRAGSRRQAEGGPSKWRTNRSKEHHGFNIPRRRHYRSRLQSVASRSIVEATRCPHPQARPRVASAPRTYLPPSLRPHLLHPVCSASPPNIAPMPRSISMILTSRPADPFSHLPPPRAW